MRLLLLISFALLSFSAPAQTSATLAGKVNLIGPYELGANYNELKDLPGFKFDTGRSKPDMGIKVGKIIDKNVFDQVTIQRLTFHRNKLVRVSIIIGDPSFTEEQAKDIVMKQWGNPGPKQKVGNSSMYVWTGALGTILILPADGGRQMITLADNDKSHYVD